MSSVALCLLGLLSVCLPAVSHGFGGQDRLELAQVVLTGVAPAQAVPRPEALSRLLWELEKRTSIEVSPDVVTVHLGDAAALHRHPLLYLAGDRAFPMPSEDELSNLRRHIQLGGLLIIDSAEGRAGGAFDQSVRAMLAKLLPQASLGRLPEDHVLFRSFYLLRVPVGRVIALPYVEAVQLRGRTAIVYSQNDLGGAWARDRFGQWLYDVVPGGEVQREQSLRLGVNLAMYALCLDYKADQVHVPFIMRRRAWQPPLPSINPGSSPSPSGTSAP
ncbi:MAG: DUF4159 domain-containing protein [Polyangia bacterium]